MTDLLIVQSADGDYLKYHELSEPIHAQYAGLCGATYEFTEGRLEPDVNAAWNRAHLIVDAFDRGFRKVVWLDSDVLVVNPRRSIFAETSDAAPLQMTRVKDSHVELPWQTSEGTPAVGWDVYNDGVLVANDTPGARAALTFVWSMRREPWFSHHHPTLWELNWLLDYVLQYPEDVEQLSQVWNWMPYAEAPPESEAVIRAYHGYPRQQRWEDFQAKYQEVYGT